MIRTSSPSNCCYRHACLDTPRRRKTPFGAKNKMEYKMFMSILWVRKSFRNHFALWFCSWSSGERERERTSLTDGTTQSQLTFLNFLKAALPVDMGLWVSHCPKCRNVQNMRMFLWVTAKSSHCFMSRLWVGWARQGRLHFYAQARLDFVFFMSRAGKLYE